MKSTRLALAAATALAATFGAPNVGAATVYYSYRVTKVNALDTGEVHLSFDQPPCGGNLPTVYWGFVGSNGGAAAVDRVLKVAIAAKLANILVNVDGHVATSGNCEIDALELK